MNSVDKSQKDSLANLDERLSNIIERLSAIRGQTDYLLNGSAPVDKNAKEGDEKNVIGDAHIGKLIVKASNIQFLLSDIETHLSVFRFG